ncbi:MAG: hypothetical protein RL417_559 [Pseudomonadota bacterium]|jgi:osmotically-inducible protein OsmY
MKLFPASPIGFNSKLHRLFISGLLSSGVVVGLTLAAAPTFATEVVSRLTRDVEDSIRQLPDLGPHSIDIETHRGFVHLKGEVSSPADISRVEDAVRKVSGVNSVKNELVALRHSAIAQRGPSTRLAESIRSRVKANHSIGHYDIEILVTGQTVALVGEVVSPEDSTTIERIARATPGVVNLDNRLTVAPPTSDLVVAANVREALRKAGDVDLEGLEISASEGVVTFTGMRPTHREIDRILGVALMVNGVRDIKSEMTIGR